MRKNKSKFDIILIASIVIGYIIYSIFWMRAAFVQINLEDAVLGELTEQLIKESTIRNISELCVYILFMIRCWNTWNGAVKRKYITYFFETGKIILGILVLGVIFTAIQYFTLDLFWVNYLMPVVILIGTTVAMCALVSGMQAKKDIKKSSVR